LDDVKDDAEDVLVVIAQILPHRSSQPACRAACARKDLNTTNVMAGKLEPAPGCELGRRPTAMGFTVL
jgi:hypothetical protein